jgi:hypothetical protein
MGGTSTVGDIDSIAQTIQPTIMIYTEVKLTARQRRGNYLQRLLHKDYEIAYSVVPSQDALAHKARRLRRGKAGVAICISRRHTTHGSLTRMEVPQGLHGYLAHVRLAPPHSRPLEIICIYAPVAETDTMDAIENYIIAARERCLRPCTATTLLLGGDYNATSYDSDRSSLRAGPADTRYRHLTQRLNLCPATGAGAGTGRAHTYRQQVADDPTSSRIHNLLVCLDTLPEPATEDSWQACSHDIIPCGAGDDHNNLVIDTPHAALGYTAPPSPPSTTPKPRTPRLRFTQANIKALLEANATDLELARLMQDYAANTALSRSTYEQSHTQAVANSSDAGSNYRQVYERELARALTHQPALDPVQLSPKLHACLQRVLRNAQHTCKHETGGNKRYLPRSKMKQYEGLMHTIRLMCIAQQTADGIHPDLSLPDMLVEVEAAMTSAVKTAVTCGSSPKGYPLKLLGCRQSHIDEALDTIRTSLPLPTEYTPEPLPTASTAASPTPTTEATPAMRLKQGIQAALTSLRAKKRAMLRKEAKQQAAQLARSLNRLLSTNPKQGHKRIFERDSDDNTTPLDYLQCPTTKIITSDRDVKMGILEDQWRPLFAPQAIAPIGGGSPNPDNRCWEQPLSADMDDSFRIATRAPQAGAARGTLFKQIQNYVLFDECLRRLANNKAKGWDGVPNEILKYLLDPLKHVIHDMFVAMWVAGKTPTAWKLSDTVLLYKKGSTLDPSNYRPIGLAITIYKAWTSLIKEL